MIMKTTRKIATDKREKIKQTHKIHCESQLLVTSSRSKKTREKLITNKAKKYLIFGFLKIKGKGKKDLKKYRKYKKKHKKTPKIHTTNHIKKNVKKIINEKVGFFKTIKKNIPQIIKKKT